MGGRSRSREQVFQKFREGHLGLCRFFRGSKIKSSSLTSPTLSILAISGSLRAASSNKTLLEAVAALAPKGVDKPVALLNASPRSIYAQVALVEILTVMSARLVEEAAVTILLLGRKMSASDIVSNQEMSEPLRQALLAFHRAIRGSL